MSETKSLRTLAEIVGPGVLSHLSLVEEHLEATIASPDPRIIEPGLTTLRAGGKRLRPMIVLVCGAVEEANAKQSDALIRAAASVEMVHMAGLVHDDILDDAPLRRGKPTVYYAYDRHTAVYTGDLIFALAFEQLAVTRDRNQIYALAMAATGLVKGELVQREDAWDIHTSRQRYVERCILKTSCLFEGATRLGAHAGGRSDIAELLARFGTKLGLAFQLTDDVLDYTAPTEQTGKTRGADLLDGTVTLPLIIACELDPSLREIDLREIKTADQAVELADRVIATGAADQVMEFARVTMIETKAVLDDAPLSAQERERLCLIAEQAVARSK